MRFVLACGLTLAVAFGGLLLQRQMPLYANWDMDLMTTVDVLQSQEGKLPQHINHTALGMVIPLHWLAKVLPLSAGTLSDVIASPLPLVPLTEANTWLRQTAPWVGALTMLLLMLGFASQSKGSGVGFWTWLGLAAVVISLPSFWNFQLLLIRTEQWAILWFALAFFLLQRPGLKTDSLWSWLGVFFFVGVGLVTKYQGLFVATGFLLLAWARLEKTGPRAWPAWPHKGAVVVALSLFLLLSSWSLWALIPHHFARFTRAIFPNVFFLGTLFVLLFPLVLPFLTWRISWVRLQQKPLVLLSILAWCFGVGLMGSFLLHFVTTLGFASSWEYLLFDWKLMFLRLPDTSMSVAKMNGPFLWSLLAHGPLLLAWIILARRAWPEQRSPEQKFILLAYGILLLLSLKFVARGGWQDAIWNEVLIVMGFALVWPKRRASFTAILLLLVCLAQVARIGLDSSRASLMFSEHKMSDFWKEPYESPENLYTETLREKAAERSGYLVKSHLVALQFAELREDLRRLAPHLDLRQVDYEERGDLLEVFAVDQGSGPEQKIKLRDVPLRSRRTDEHFPSE